jgi:hypothetical protein
MLLFVASVGTIIGAGYVAWEWAKELQKDLNSQTVQWSQMVGHIPVGLALLCALVSGAYTLFHA